MNKVIFVVELLLCTLIGSVHCFENGYIRGGEVSKSRTLIQGENFFGCIEVKGGSNSTGTQLILGNCTTRANGFEENKVRKGEIYTFYLRKDPSKCMQVDGSSARTIKDGTNLVLKPCNTKERLQIFRHNAGFALFPVDRKDLCVHHFGATPDVGRDRILLKNCTRVPFTGDWSFD